MLGPACFSVGAIACHNNRLFAMFNKRVYSIKRYLVDVEYGGTEGQAMGLRGDEGAMN